ncbi:uncharacterized protein LOC106173023 [Lingula anatina]|uniref:Uncharacterized protein LOC106173023 n=1 Tax=Lingula anatina TaxID=7574 RepID=A0A1S3JGC8_LINAN|nr:uncharacterized protein LOC106173023 [Lingula anatina]|eukprot:XP_013409452.1 uncharacterized protein LOC106173023 [Lingula anatina]
MASVCVGSAFIPYYNQLMQILETNEDMKKTAKGIFKQMATAAGGAAVGGIVGGPAGALVGTCVGAVAGYMMSDEYSSMIKVLKNMTDEEKKKIVAKVQELVGSELIGELMRFVSGQVQREMLLQTLRDCVSDVKGA